MKYSNENPNNFNTCPYNNNGNTKNDCWQNFTPQTAEEFVFQLWVDILKR
ncbi:putative outer membrane protein [Helicobacter pylori 908]|nr:putative outer membrane protein [Helicobacter pylori 908]